MQIQTAAWNTKVFLCQNQCHKAYFFFLIFFKKKKKLHLIFY